MYCGTRLTAWPGWATSAAAGMATMLALEALAQGISLVGVDPTLVVTVVAVVPIGEGAVQLVYKAADGALKDRPLTRGDEASISIATLERLWSFDDSGEDFKFAVIDTTRDDNARAVKIASADEPTTSSKEVQDLS